MKSGKEKQDSPYKIHYPIMKSLKEKKILNDIPLGERLDLTLRSAGG